MFKHVFAALTAAATFAGSAPVQADGFYYGATIGTSHGDAEIQGGGPTSDGTFGTLGGVMGYRWDRTGLFYGAEFATDMAVGGALANPVAGTCATGALGPYFCRTNATVRMRGLIGRDFGNGYEGFGSLGYALAFGTGAISPGATAPTRNGGLTLGFGLQRDIGSGNTVRYELIYDHLTDNHRDNTGLGLGGAPNDYRSISLNVSLLFGG